MRADGDEDRIEPSLVTLGGEVLDAMRGGDAHTQHDDALKLGVEHVARHSVGGDPVAHHPARLLAGVADLDLVAESRQVVGG